VRAPDRAWITPSLSLNPDLRRLDIRALAKGLAGAGGGVALGIAPAQSQLSGVCGDLRAGPASTVAGAAGSMAAAVELGRLAPRHEVFVLTIADECSAVRRSHAPAPLPSRGSTCTQSTYTFVSLFDRDLQVAQNSAVQCSTVQSVHLPCHPFHAILI
jgi:hypothetical protein